MKSHGDAPAKCQKKFEFNFSNGIHGKIHITFPKIPHRSRIRILKSGIKEFEKRLQSLTPFDLSPPWNPATQILIGPRFLSHRLLSRSLRFPLLFLLLRVVFRAASLNREGLLELQGSWPGFLFKGGLLGPKKQPPPRRWPLKMECF